MRRPELRFRVRHLMIGVAIAAVGLFLLRAIWGRADDIIVRKYSEDWRPWNRGREFRIRLDPDRLRANNFSREDVIKALMPSSLNPPKRVAPPPGVVFMEDFFDRPDQFENIVIVATPEGEVIRLKDIAKVEASY